MRRKGGGISIFNNTITPICTTSHDKVMLMGMDVMKTETLSLEEIATALRVNVETPRRWVRSGKLKAFKAGGQYRVLRPSLDDFLQLPKEKGGRPPGTGKPPDKQKVALSTSQRRARLKK